jgi:NitT/TauT family transport system substrate-binding protein
MCDMVCGMDRKTPEKRPIRGNVLRALLLLLAGSAAFAEDGPPPFRFLMQWTPQSQFAGYYMALEKGLYEKQGVAVEIIEGGPEHDPAAYLRGGKAEFATLFLTGALAARDEGLPLVHLAQMVNRCNQMILGWKQQGIRAIGDLDGQRVSIWGGGFRPAYAAVFEEKGIRPEIVPQYYSVNLFLLHGVAACSAMEYNEYHMIYQSGADYDELFTWRLRDEGFGFPEDGIYCTAETFRKWPGACRAVAEASLEGWRMARENPEEALDIVMHHVLQPNIPTNRPHMKWMLEKILPSILPEEAGTWEPGVLKKAAYEKAAAAMKKNGVIESAPSYEVFLGAGAADAP